MYTGNLVTFLLMMKGRPQLKLNEPDKHLPETISLLVKGDSQV